MAAMNSAADAVVAQMKQSLSKMETEEGEEAAGEPDWEVEALAGSVAATSRHAPWAPRSRVKWACTVARSAASSRHVAPATLHAAAGASRRRRWPASATSPPAAAGTTAAAITEVISVFEI